jgi:cytochrome c biogenesis protein CcmG, thiol:disulfide interchange protein DsbE
MARADPNITTQRAPTGRARRDWLRAAIGLALGGAFAAGAARAGALALGASAPPLVLRTLDGRDIDTRALRGQVVIATFWATWCVPCRTELPLLSAYAARHAQHGLQVLGFSLDGPDRLREVRAVAATLAFPVGLLGSPWAGAYGRIWRVPVSFVIDRAGRLAHDGWDDADPAWTAERLQRIVDPLLAAR